MCFFLDIQRIFFGYLFASILTFFCSPGTSDMRSPIQVAAADFAMLQLQVAVSNSSTPLEEDDLLMDVLLQQQAFVAKSWASLVEVAHKSEVRIPFWAMICSLVLVGVLLFYLVNYMLVAQRQRSQRQHDLEDAKKHSEHGNMLGSLVEARQMAILIHFTSF